MPVSAWRTRIVLRDLLDLLGNLITTEQFHQFERFVKTGRNTAARDAVTIDHKPWVPLDDFHRGEFLQTGNERPMGRRFVAIE